MVDVIVINESVCDAHKHDMRSAAQLFASDVELTLRAMLEQPTITIAFTTDNIYCRSETVRASVLLSMELPMPDDQLRSALKRAAKLLKKKLNLMHIRFALHPALSPPTDVPQTSRRLRRMWVDFSHVMAHDKAQPMVVELSGNDVTEAAEIVQEQLRLGKTGELRRRTRNMMQDLGDPRPGDHDKDRKTSMDIPCDHLSSKPLLHGNQTHSVSVGQKLSIACMTDKWTRVAPADRRIPRAAHRQYLLFDKVEVRETWPSRQTNRQLNRNTTTTI